MTLFRSALGAVALAMTVPASAADNSAEIFELPSVNVVGTAPLPGLGTPLRDVPANVQIFDNRLFARMRSLTLTQFLDLDANSVGAASGQGNAFQQSLNFRGFAASPLLGTPQGVSVFQDGVRINEAFGDVVNWDLLPRSAISTVQLIPGSVPAFGLNTLGGALAIYTKSGAQYPGLAVEASGGMFGRRALEFEYGAATGHLDAFATGNLSDDDGWAQHNASRVRQFFGKVGWEDERSDLDVSLTLADNALHGAQTLPLSFLDRPRESYTYPDLNQNRLAFIVAKGSRFVGDAQLIDANAYYRRFRNANLSSNVNDDFGETDHSGNASTNEAFNDNSSIDQKSWGLGAQLTIRGEWAGIRHQLLVGASGDFGDTRFDQHEQPANFSANRGTVASGPFTLLTDVSLKNAYTGIFFSDTMSLSERWTLSVAGRWNRAHVQIADRSGEDPQLDGSSTFTRFNPSIGVNFNPTQTLTAYASYNEGMRAPTPIELTCADPTAPCKLPNEFLSDPPLNKVVSKTAELGARGRISPSTTWSAAIYRTELDDDIQFISSRGAVNAGFFQNVGQTRRQGVELAMTTHLGPMKLDLRYNHIDATFRSTFSALAPNNSSADPNGAITVQPGDRIPGIPANSFKLRAEYARGPLSIGAGLVAVSNQYAHGDENNADTHGKVPGYTVVNLDAQYSVTPHLQIFAQVANLFDTRYYSFAVLGENVFTGPGNTFGPALGISGFSEQFRAVGTPRALWIGARYRFDKAAPS